MIGRGNYGEVWLAQNVMGTYRGVKVVHRSSFDNDGPYEREFAGIRKFEPISRSHESQLDLLQIGRNNAAGYFYYVMELADDAEQGPDIGVVEGPADGKPRTAQRARTPALRPSDTPTHRDPSTPLLHDPQAYVPRTLEHDLKGGGRLPFEECLRISLALAGALRHLHGHGLVHRDIKPGNIIFINGIPKLADIGLVTDSDATLICFGGSQGFSAPEGPGRPQGDIYSLGKVIYEMCTGRDRMDFPKLPEDFGKWPDRKHVCEMLAVINKACEPDLANRYGSAEQLSKDLVMVQAGKSVRRLRWLERHRRWALAALAVTMGAAVVVSSFLKSWVLRQEILRVGFIRAAQAASFTEHQAGWRRKALENLQKAAQIRLDDDIRAEAVDVFAGPDVTNRPPLINGGADHLVFDAQGRRLLMDGGLEGQQARLLDTTTGQLTEFTNSGRGPVWFAPDGPPRLLRVAEPGTYEVMDPEDGRQISKFQLGPGPYDEQPRQILPMAVSPNGKLGAIAAPLPRTAGDADSANRRRLAVWNIETRAAIKPAEGDCASLAFSPDGALLALGDSHGGVQVHSLPDWGLVAAFTNDDATVHCLAFGPDPKQPLGQDSKYPWLLAAGDSGGTVWIHSLSQPWRTPCRGSSYDVYALAFSPDGTTLASSGRADVRFWDVATGRLSLMTGGHDFAVALAFSPNGEQLAVGFQKGFGNDVARVRLLSLDPERAVRALRGVDLSVWQGRVFARWAAAGGTIGELGGGPMEPRLKQVRAGFPRTQRNHCR